MSYDIRTMTRADLDMAVGWAREEGWNPGLDDADAFYAMDATGFLVGVLDGEPVSSISVVKYGERFAFLGFYIVRPTHRGKGLGKALWDAGIASAADSIIGLDGVVDQQDNYRKSGFALAHPSARWGGIFGNDLAVHPLVRPLEASDLAAVLAYDAGVYPAAREPFLSHWLRRSAAREAVGYFDAGELYGYGVIRRAVEGWKIGPLFADSPSIAEALIETLGRRAGGHKVCIDVPEPNAAGLAIAHRLKFSPAFATARMYRGVAPSLPVERIFGITSLELG